MYRFVDTQTCEISETNNIYRNAIYIFPFIISKYYQCSETLLIAFHL